MKISSQIHTKEACTAKTTNPENNQKIAEKTIYTSEKDKDKVAKDKVAEQQLVGPKSLSPISVHK